MQRDVRWQSLEFCPEQSAILFFHKMITVFVCGGGGGEGGNGGGGILVVVVFVVVAGSGAASSAVVGVVVAMVLGHLYGVSGQGVRLQCEHPGFSPRCIRAMTTTLAFPWSPAVSAYTARHYAHTH